MTAPARDRPGHATIPAASGRLERIRSALQAQLEPVRLQIADDSAAHAGHAGSGAGGHFRVHVVSARFAGRAPLQRHRLVYGAVAHLMGSDIHALNIVAETPEESTS